MANINVNLNKAVGKIKPMHAVGQPPLAGASSCHFHYLTECGAPYSRLHDVGGAYGGNRFVDIPNIFRDFDADVNDPASYDFAFTDHLITELIKAGIEPYYRLGVTIENDAWIKPYRIFPPKDYEKWAEICEHIIAHYNEGWANGFHYNITYWEIWNEPDGGGGVEDEKAMMWRGSNEDFYRLYDVTAKHLKKCFPNIKVGGYGCCGHLLHTQYAKNTKFKEETLVALNRQEAFFHGFFKYISEHNSPIDFYSWHSYYRITTSLEMDKWVKERLIEYGYGDIEIHLNEWNNGARMFRGTEIHAAECAAMLLGMQHSNTDICFVYDARWVGGEYSALFDGFKGIPTPTYYSFVAFNSLYKLGNEVELVCDDSSLYVLAASDGNHHAIMLANTTDTDKPLEISGVDLKDARFYVTDSYRTMTWSPNANTIPKHGVVLIEI